VFGVDCRQTGSLHCFRFARHPLAMVGSGNRASRGECSGYCNSAYSALACFRTWMLGSASFQIVRKSL
jgi:hypothetical protein